MDRRMKQDLDHYLTTPPEDDSYVVEMFFESIKVLYNKVNDRRISEEQCFEGVLDELERLGYF